MRTLRSFCYLVIFFLIYIKIEATESLESLNHPTKNNYTITTAFFNIKRDKWTWYTRSVENYLQNAKRVLSLDDYMVIYIEPEWVDFVQKHREKFLHKTKIIPMNLEDLQYYKYNERIQDIMESEEYKKGLADPTVPEVRESLYNVVTWSKVPLVVKTIETNPFDTTHFVWLDFGSHPHILQEHMLNKPLLEEIPNKIKLGCRSHPSPEDLDIKTFFKAHRNRLMAGLITGNAENFKIFNSHLEEEIANALSERVVDCEQSFFTLVFLKHPELFTLHYADWGQLISNYYQINQNLTFVLDIAFKARDQGDGQLFLEILKQVGPYSPKMWYP